MTTVHFSRILFPAFLMSVLVTIDGHAKPPYDVMPSGLANANGYKAYWGDVHTHSDASSDYKQPKDPNDAIEAGCASIDTIHDIAPDCPSECGGKSGPEYLIERAKENGLDFVVFTDHPEDISVAEWEATKSAVSQNSNGQFIAFQGYEYCQYVPVQQGSADQCTNVIFRDVNSGNVYAHDYYNGRKDGRCKDRVQPPSVWKANEAQLWASIIQDGHAAIGVYAHPESNKSWATHPLEKRMVIAGEVTSGGGLIGVGDWEREPRNKIVEGIRSGIKFGFVAGGNDHAARAGLGPKTAVLSRAFNRNDIFSGMKNRNTFATRGKQVLLSFDATVDGQAYLMGSDIAKVPNPMIGKLQISLLVSASAPGGETIGSIAIYELKGKGEPVQVANFPGAVGGALGGKSLRKGEYAAYWAEAKLQGDEKVQAWTSPIYIRAVDPVPAAKAYILSD